MSVLNQSGEEQVECPLCMEPLEVDDLTFFPCSCGYQICRFCWHRIRTDENGLCPACRKVYEENPADFIPLTQEQVAKLKAEKRQRDQQKKAKLSESRKHLASVRVVQRNLVFVVGLPMRLAEPEMLKRHEYFGKFGKIHKVVINQSTSYAGSQGPSASAYVTYVKSDDALRAIQSVNNITIDGRLIKSSLGTTKYCSHFMKNQLCPKPDCMYLHDFGDPEASFTKEQMHAGKHQEYEKKLHDILLQRSNNNSSNSNQNVTQGSGNVSAVTEQPQQQQQPQQVTKSTAKSKETTANSTNKENWPQLSEKEAKEKKEKSEKEKSKKKVVKEKEKKEKKGESAGLTSMTKSEKESNKGTKECDSIDKLSILDDNSSFFSHNSFQKIVPNSTGEDCESPTEPSPSLLTDSLPVINTTEDWAAAFGFNQPEHLQNSTETSSSSDSFFHTEDFRNLIETSKLQDNVREVLQTNKNNGFTTLKQSTSTTQDSYFGKESGLDQHMSKFFMDFHQKNGQKQDAIYNSMPVNNHHATTNSMNGYTNHINNYFVNTDQLLLHQKKLEEHLMSMSLKSQQQHHHHHHHNNHHHHQQNYGPITTHTNGQYMNGDATGGQNGYGYQETMFTSQQTQQMAKNRTHSEDDLGFDPFQETQKALAELIANEQSYKSHSNVRNGTTSGQTNGIVQNQGSKNHLPPPPPGFVQPTTHMNSFGSKILPFLNMSNNQPINSTTQNWPSYNVQVPPQQQQQPKNVNSNDWKDFDSAILSTSRHYPVMQPISNPFRSIQQLGTQQIPNGSLRSHEYTNNTFSNFTQQLQQPNYNNYASHINSTSTTQQSNWFTSELNTQISSPPGFRNSSQTSKQQEC